MCSYHRNFFFLRKDNYVTETQYQTELIKKLERRFPGSMVLRTDAGYQQGIPDLFLLYDHMWAALEVKAKRNSTRQPNQDYFVNELNHMSFAAYIYPENEEEVLDALQQAFESSRRACLPIS